MLKSEEKTIEGIVDGAIQPVEYIVQQFPAMKAMRIAVKLGKTVGGGIGVAAKGGFNDVMNMDVGAIISEIMCNLDEIETPKLVAEVLSQTKRNGVFLTEDVINKVYAGNFGEMFKAIQFSLEVNFGGFIKALAIAGNTGSPAELDAEKRK
jgi:hypothetical protein